MKICYLDQFWCTPLAHKCTNAWEVSRNKQMFMCIITAQMKADLVARLTHSVREGVRVLDRELQANSVQFWERNAKFAPSVLESMRPEFRTINCAVHRSLPGPIGGDISLMFIYHSSIQVLMRKRQSVQSPMPDLNISIDFKINRIFPRQNTVHACPSQFVRKPSLLWQTISIHFQVYFIWKNLDSPVKRRHGLRP